eukprot:scaffold94236_cov23-Tisochrysis_lutea.AAC.2
MWWASRPWLQWGATFSQVVWLIGSWLIPACRAFNVMGPKDKVKLFEILSTNLSELAISVNNLHQDHFSSSDPVVSQHRSAVQVRACASALMCLHLRGCVRTCVRACVCVCTRACVCAWVCVCALAGACVCCTFLVLREHGQLLEGLMFSFLLSWNPSSDRYAVVVALLLMCIYIFVDVLLI